MVSSITLQFPIERKLPFRGDAETDLGFAVQVSNDKYLPVVKAAWGTRTPTCHWEIRLLTELYRWGTEFLRMVDNL